MKIFNFHGGIQHLADQDPVRNAAGRHGGANMAAVAQELLPHFRDRLPQNACREAAE